MESLGADYKVSQTICKPLKLLWIFDFVFLWPLETCFPACLLHCLKIMGIKKCLLTSKCELQQNCEGLGPRTTEIKCVFIFEFLQGPTALGEEQ